MQKILVVEEALRGYELGAVAVLSYKMWRPKKDIYDYADSFEKSLDAVIEGRTPDQEGETEDTLSGRVNEKLQRTEHILGLIPFSEKENQMKRKPDLTNPQEKD